MRNSWNNLLHSKNYDNLKLLYNILVFCTFANK